MKTQSKHPERLLWWISGKLDPEEAASIQSHVDSCGLCQDDVDRFSSIRRALLSRPAAAQPHVSVEQLVTFQGGTTPLDTVERDSIQRHIETCASCHDDFELLEAASGVSEKYPHSTQRPARPMRWVWAAGILVLLAASATWYLQIPAFQTRILVPALRDAQDAPELEGPGPWRVLVELPLDAPDGAYVGRIAPADDSPVLYSDLAATARRGQLELVIPVLPAAGRYRLELAPRGIPADYPYSYQFRVGSPNP